ncbi:hypothetical protein ACIQC9_13090 [Brevundimonas sp. NPDC092305]|uniref:hypothetical protein n=1 Tax=Brevundimonas sp. NPDC092305 TaxID=3363957 RepID=UPI0037F26B61
MIWGSAILLDQALGKVDQSAPAIFTSAPEDATVMVGLTLAVAGIVKGILIPLIVFVSIARRLKDAGITRWLTPVFFAALGCLPIFMTGVILGLMEGPGYLSALAVLVLLSLTLMLVPGDSYRSRRASGFA